MAREREVVELHVRVTGIVQGVGYRWFVRDRGRPLGLAGWVRNMPDGSVEVAASGDEQQVELLRVELMRGPSGAMIKTLDDLDDVLAEPLGSPFGIIH